MSGTLEVESEKGTGSTFHLRLLSKYTRIHPLSPFLSTTSPVSSPLLSLSPKSAALLSDPSSARSSPPPLHLNDPPAPGKTILLVEDNLMNQLLLVRLLKIKGMVLIYHMRVRTHSHNAYMLP